MGGFSGKIGNIVGVRNSDGSCTIRSRQAVVNNPQSPAQQTQRVGFGLCASLFKIAEPFVAQGLRNVAGKKPRGAFISLNSRTAIGGTYPDLHIDYQYLTVAEGLLMPADSPVLSWNPDDNLAFSWTDNSGQGIAKADDRAMLLVINPEKKDCLYSLKGNDRSSEQDILEIPNAYRHDELHAYIAFTTSNDTMISDSVYLAV